MGNVQLVFWPGALNTPQLYALCVTAAAAAATPALCVAGAAAASQDLAQQPARGLLTCGFG